MTGVQTCALPIHTIADLENIECSTGVQYISAHTSPLIKFFKKEISVSDYLSAVKDERGIISESIDDLDEDIEESGLEDEQARPHKAKKSKTQKSVADEQQLSLFDI